MAMDRAEKLGLGAAIGGHVVLLGAMAIGLLMSTERLTKTQPISVSLVGEIADVSTAPDAIQEESAPPAKGETETPEPQTTPNKMQIEKPVPKPVEKPQKRDVAPVPAKAAPKKVAVKQLPAKQAAKSGGFSKNFEDVINNAGKAPGVGKAVGTPAAKTAAEVRRSVNSLLGPQIKPYLKGCSPSGIDVNKLETYVTLYLDRTGRLTNVAYDKQTGLSESNKPQSGTVRDCIMQAVRSASPYSGLDPEYYDVWKKHPMRMRPTG